MDTNEIVLTPEGREKLVEELTWREGEKTNEIIERLKNARSFGDLSENSEYDDAKDEQSKNAARIAEIRKILSSAKVSDEKKGRTVKTAIGCKVEVEDDKGNKRTFTIVGPTETDSLDGRISNESPLGAALMGKKKGDEAQFVLPNGKKKTYKVLKVSR